MDSVKIIECPRDAWQGLPQQIPAERKVSYLRGLIAAGFKHIDAVSFVSPKAVPQMADSEQVLAQLGRVDGLDVIGIVVNAKGVERAINSGAVTTLGFPTSISETFLSRNQKQTMDENRAVLKIVKERADDAGLKVVAYISMAFGNPYGERWGEEQVAEAAHSILDLGIGTISIADTIGAAEPELIDRVVTSVLRECVDCEVGVHLHSTRTRAAVKILAAYDAGCRRFDCAIGGLGGCPFAQDELVGNVPTEEVLAALERRDVQMPIDLSKVTGLNSAITAEFASEGSAAALPNSRERRLKGSAAETASSGHT